jgi:heptosyltransferase-3
MKILLIKFRNIGDVLLSTPLLENLKHHYPDSQIDFTINKECIDMLSLNPYISNIITYDRKYIKKLNFFKKIIKEIQFINSIKKSNYNIVINLTEGDRGAILSYFSGAETKLGFRVRKGIFSKLKIFDKIADDTKNIHTVEKDLQFLKLLNKKIISKNVNIYWGNNAEKTINNILKENNITQFVHIHPVSRWMFKCWEDDRMAKIIDYFQQEKNIKVVITGAPISKELGRINNIIKLCKTQPLNLSGILSLKHLAYLSSKAQLFFGVDTAPMHIAASVNTKVIALFGASNVVRWGPWDNNNWHHYTDANTIQSTGKHTTIVNNNHTIFYQDNVKKCKGMSEIHLKSILKLI